MRVVKEKRLEVIFNCVRTFPLFSACFSFFFFRSSLKVKLHYRLLQGPGVNATRSLSFRKPQPFPPATQGKEDLISSVFFLYMRHANRGIILYVLILKAGE